MNTASTRECIRRWYETHPLYPSWNGMRRVCGVGASRTDREKRLYAGVGICDQWMKYQAFEDWALGKGWRKGLKVVRVDKTGDFCPENCVIVPYGVAVNMRRNTFRVDGVPLRTIIGSTPRRGDRRYLRIRDRISKCRFDTESAMSVPTLTPSQCQALSTRSRESSLT